MRWPISLRAGAGARRRDHRPEPYRGTVVRTAAAPRAHHPAGAGRWSQRCQYSFLFDILTNTGVEAIGLHYRQRRDRPQDRGFDTAPVQTPPYWIDIGADRLLAAAADTDVEGAL